MLTSAEIEASVNRVLYSVLRQDLRVQELARAGHDNAYAVSLLRSLQGTLRCLEESRVLIAELRQQGGMDRAYGMSERRSRSE